MTTNVSLIDELHARVSPRMIATISKDLRVAPFQAGGAVKRAIPTALAGIIDGASTETGASRVLHAATQAKDTGILEGAHTLDADGTRRLGAQGERMLGFVFGDRALEGVDAVARSSSTTRELSFRALGTVAPLALAVIGREAASRRLDATGLMQFLRAQRPLVLASPDLPHDPALGRIVRGAETVSVVETPVARNATTPPPTHRRSAAGLGWLLALVGLMALLVLLLAAIGGARRGREHASTLSRSEAPTTDEPIAGPPPEGTSSEEPSSTTTTTGATMDTSSSTAHPDWSSYKLNFQFGSTKLADEGEQSLKAIGDALIANPNERIKLVGHTDSIGDGDYNRQLAMNRAATVKKELVERGVDPSRIDLSGPGEAKPIADNKTNEGRAENRRVEVVTASP